MSFGASVEGVKVKAVPNEIRTHPLRCQLFRTVLIVHLIDLIGGTSFDSAINNTWYDILILNSSVTFVVILPQQYWYTVYYCHIIFIVLAHRTRAIFAFVVCAAVSIMRCCEYSNTF